MHCNYYVLLLWPRGVVLHMFSRIVLIFQFNRLIFIQSFFYKISWMFLWCHQPIRRFLTFMVIILANMLQLVMCNVLVPKLVRNYWIAANWGDDRLLFLLIKWISILKIISGYLVLGYLNHGCAVLHSWYIVVYIVYNKNEQTNNYMFWYKCSW